MTERPYPGITNRIASSIARSLTVRRAIGAIACLVFIIAAGIIAPGETPGVWVWTRLLLATASAGIALALVASSNQPDTDPRERGIYGVLTGVFLLITLILSATFTALTALFAIVVLTLVLLHVNARGPSSAFVFWALLGTLVPFWVWSAFEAWDRWLLMLLPLGIIGLISLEHALRSDLSPDDVANRYASWIGITLMAATMLLTSILMDAQARWLTMGGIVVAILAGLDLSPARKRMSEALPAFTIPALALLVLAFAWLIAL